MMLTRCRRLRSPFRPVAAGAARVLAAALLPLAGACTQQQCPVPEHSPGRVVFRYATAEPAGSIDPRTVTGPSRALATNLFEGLVSVDEAGRVQFTGASGVSVSQDGLTYTFALRPEVKWSDGTPVTAHDYEYAYRTALAPGFGSETANILYLLRNAERYNSGRLPSSEQVGARALDSLTLQLNLEQPGSRLLQTMSTAYVFMPVPRHVVEKAGTAWTDATHIVTNGPYRISRWTRNANVTLTRNPHYWGARPYVDEVLITLIPDPGGRALTMYEAGDLDFAAVARSDMARVRSESVLARAAHTTRVPRLYGLFLDHRTRPFDDVRVRKALYLAIDREALRTISRNQLVPTYSPIPQLVPGHSEDIRVRGDATTAAQLLREAGYPRGRGIGTLTLVIRSSMIESLQGQAIQAMLRQTLGIEVHIEALEAGAFRDFVTAAREGKRFHMALYTATADNPDPWLYHNVMIGSGGAGYYRTHWRNAAYDELLGVADRELDPRRRLELYRQLDRLVVDDVGMIPVSSEDLTYVVNPAFAGIFIPYGERDPNVSRAVAGTGAACAASSTRR